LTDYVFGAKSALPYALSLTSGLLGPIAVYVVWYGMKPYAASVVRARAWT
jgi:hypothetical protein